MSEAPVLITPQTREELDTLRSLLREYQLSLGVDLCFQNFEQELAGLPGDYAPPHGRLILGLIDGEAACCVALRRHDAESAEMKRLYVRPAYRGRGLGVLLARTVIEEARIRGCRRLLLDTLPEMKEAQSLYSALGFHDVPAYTVNPVPGSRFMALELRAKGV